MEASTEAIYLFNFHRPIFSCIVIKKGVNKTQTIPHQAAGYDTSKISIIRKFL